MEWIKPTVYNKKPGLASQIRLQPVAVLSRQVWESCEIPAHPVVWWMQNGADRQAWKIQQVSKCSLFNFPDKLRAKDSSLTLIKS